MKTVKGIFLMMAMTVLFAGQIFAQAAAPSATDDKAAKQTTVTTQTCGKFVDNNNDGICDNHAGKQCTGVKGANFTDANGDGVCDHKVDGKCGNGNQAGCRHDGNGCPKGQGTPHQNGCGHCAGQKAPDKK